MTDDAVTITIGEREWKHWDSLELHLSLDSHATAGFNAPFEPDRSAFRDTFRPFSFKEVVIRVGGERLFTGTLVEVTPNLDAGARTVTVSCYSKAAVLEDCCPPASMGPIEANGLTLRQIAERLAAPFGIEVAMTAAEGSPFKRVKSRQHSSNNQAEQDQSVQDFLLDLARQRGLVISSDPDGALLFQRSVAPGHPVVRLVEGVPPLTSVTPTFSPQSYFDEITGFTSAKRGRIGSKYTERVERLSGGALRTLSFKLDDIEKADAVGAVRAKMARMFAHIVKYVVSVPVWRDPQGILFRPNTTLLLQAPGAMVYHETELLIRDVYLKASARERTASLGLVLPGAFSGEQPPLPLPWEDL
jgi:prophage tail gpP-like protein